MKMYLLTEADMDRLKLMIDRDPEHGSQGGSSNSSINDPGKRLIYSEAHRFYNYQIYKWIDEVSK